MPLDCQHRPPCGVAVSRWNCARRTSIEAALKRGTLTVREAERLLRTFGLPMSPSAKAYHGLPDEAPRQRRLDES